MKAKLLTTSFASVAPTFLLVLAGFFLSPSAHAQASWNAYRDFYLSPTVSGWGGSTYPSGFGSAWGYYMGNVNGSGFPASVGTYLTSGQIYKYTSHNPAGSADSTVYGTTLWDATGGAGFARYRDTLSWGTSLGRYDNAWVAAAPAASNRIWMQAGWLGGGASEGIASILTWTAPSAGTYDFTGSFQIGEQPDSGASIAIVDSTGGIPLARTVATMGSNQAFNFRKTLNQGDIVQFQVGTDYKTGAAVGLDVDVALVEVTSWNAYTDFYFDSTSNSNNVGSWTGAKSPSPAGKAWGYYIANANANGFPDRIGDYFPPGNDLSLKQALYAMANHKPLGVGQQQAGGFSGANDAWYSTGGKGTSVYEDRYGHGSQIGSFDVPWYEGAPACPSGGIWMRAGYLGNTGAEGICPVVTWTAPYPGIYKFQGSFVAGTDGSGASVAVVDSTGGVPLLARTALTPGNSQAFVFTKILNPGDVIQFQVGSDYKADAPVGLNVIVSRIQQNFNAFGEFWMSGRMISPVPDGLSDGGPAAWSNIVDATIQGRSPNTPTYPNAWSYGVINCTGGTPSANDFQPTSITGENPEGMIYRAAWQQFFSLEDGVTGIYAAGVPLWSYQSSGAQVGWYGSAWYFDAPGNDGNGAGRNGLSTAPNSNKKYLWMKVGPGASDGVAPVVRWTAPANGTYRFKGEFLPGGNGAGTMSTAVLTYNNPDLELGTEIVLDRQITTHDGDVRPFDFNLTVVGGQTVSWVVGADGDATGDVMGLQAEVSPVKTSLTLSGVSVANKTYNGNNSATLQGTPTLVGISPGDDVSLMNVVAIFDTPDVGSRNVSIAADLAGADASKYSLTLPTGITGTIDKATPTISSAPTASAITQGETLASSILSGGTGSVAGTFAWTTSSTIPLSTASYPVTFTPTDSANYNTATTSVSVTVNSAAPTGASFTSWRGSSPASAALLQNYAFGAASPSSTLSQSSLPSSAVVSGKLVLTYYVRQEATNPNLVVPQLSTDLASPGNWADLGSSSIATISIDTVDGVQVVKKTASVPVDSTPRKFLRLKIQE